VRPSRICSATATEARSALRFNLAHSSDLMLVRESGSHVSWESILEFNGRRRDVGRIAPGTSFSPNEVTTLDGAARVTERLAALPPVLPEQRQGGVHQGEREGA
jgi:hypothetical protein